MNKRRATDAGAVDPALEEMADKMNGLELRCDFLQNRCRANVLGNHIHCRRAEHALKESDEANAFKAAETAYNAEWAKYDEEKRVRDEKLEAAHQEAVAKSETVAKASSELDAVRKWAPDDIAGPQAAFEHAVQESTDAKAERCRLQEEAARAQSLADEQLNSARVAFEREEDKWQARIEDCVNGMVDAKDDAIAQPIEPFSNAYLRGWYAGKQMKGKAVKTVLSPAPSVPSPPPLDTANQLIIVESAVKTWPPDLLQALVSTVALSMPPDVIKALGQQLMGCAQRFYPNVMNAPCIFKLASGCVCNSTIHSGWRCRENNGVIKFVGTDHDLSTFDSSWTLCAEAPPEAAVAEQPVIENTDRGGRGLQLLEMRTPEAMHERQMMQEPVTSHSGSERADECCSEIDSLAVKRCVKGDGNCSIYAPLDCLHLLEHGQEGTVEANPTELDLGRAQRVREKNVELLLSDEGVEIRANHNLQLPQDEAAIREMLQGPKYEGDGLEKLAHWKSPVYLEATAKTLVIDIFSRRPKGPPAVYFHNTQWTEDANGRKHPRQMTEAEAAQRLREPTAVPLVVIDYDGHNHFASRRQHKRPAYEVPEWLKNETCTESTASNASASDNLSSLDELDSMMIDLGSAPLAEDMASQPGFSDLEEEADILPMQDTNTGGSASPGLSTDDVLAMLVDSSPAAGSSTHSATPSTSTIGATHCAPAQADGKSPDQGGEPRDETTPDSVANGRGGSAELGGCAESSVATPLSPSDGLTPPMDCIGSETGNAQVLKGRTAPSPATTLSFSAYHVRKPMRME